MLASRERGRRGARIFKGTTTFRRRGPTGTLFLHDIPGLDELIHHGLNSCCNVAAWPGRQRSQERQDFVRHRFHRQVSILGHIGNPSVCNVMTPPREGSSARNTTVGRRRTGRLEWWRSFCAASRAGAGRLRFSIQHSARQPRSWTRASERLVAHPISAPS